MERVGNEGALRPTRFTFIARHQHWLDHLMPVYTALPPDRRGAFWTKKENVPYAEAQGVEATPTPAWPKLTRSDRVVICGEADRAAVATVPVIRLEHGVGISYGGKVPIPPGAPRRAIESMATHHSYAGGRGQRNVRAFLNPNTYSDDRWKAAYPNVPTVIVGSPKMDRWVGHRPSNPRPVVAVSFHANFTLCPETQSTFPYYSAALLALAQRTDIEVVVHVHPRARNLVEPFYAEHGLRYWPNFADVLERADAYVIDNSSTLYEFAATGRPVVILNSPLYRRNVQHGLRFWDYSDIGPTCERPRDLCAAVDEALEDPEPYPARRLQATEHLYPYLGRARERAAEVLCAL